MGDGNGVPGARQLVSFFIPHLGTGGVERVTINLATEIARRGHEAHVVVSSATGGLSSSVRDPVSLIDLGATRTAGALRKLAAYLVEHRPAAILSSKTHANAVTMLAHSIARTDTRIVLCEHSRFQFEQRGGYRDRLAISLAARLYPWADQIVAVAPDVAAACSARLRLDEDLLKVIPNPVVTPELRKLVHEAESHPWLQDGARVFLGVGRLVPEKDFDLLIRAFREVSRQVEARLLILGDGPLRGPLRQLVAELGLEDLVDLPGDVANPLPYMREADAFVLSSVSEGFPMVLVEALLAGAPVIATRCSEGVAQVLEDGTYGALVPVRDVGALTESMLNLDQLELPSKELRRARAEDFSVEVIASIYERLILGD